ncbi:hypothetical protein PENTCL1PPCAC_21264, partial [Pristionchus entomophagus]
MSGSIRTRIGQARRRLRLHIEPVKSTMLTESATSTTPLAQRNDDEIMEDTQVILEVRAPFAKAYKALLKEHEAFTSLRSSSPAEEAEYQKYIKSYGDYTVELEKASDLLASVDSLVDRLMAEGRSRSLSMTDDNDDALTTTTGKSIEPTPAPRSSIKQSNPTASSLSTPLPPGLKTSNSSPENVDQVHGAILSTSFTPVETTIEHTLQHPLAAPAPQVIYTDTSSAFVTAALMGKSLPHFSGDVLEWPEFFESFVSLITHGRITGADKLSLLKMCLSGEAQELIAGLPKLDRNYEQAIVLLQQYFDKKHLRDHSLFTRLRKLQPCDRDGRNLRTFYLKLNVIVHQLLPNGEIDTPDMLVHLITSKLPIGMQTRIIKESARKSDFGVFSVLAILADAVEDEKIENEIMANNRTERRHENDRRAEKTSTSNQSNPNRSETTRDRAPRSNTKPSRFFPAPRNCRLCDGLHRENACATYTTPEDRRTAAYQMHLCLNCLKSQHRTEECKNPTRCYKCKEMHHTSICKKPTSIPSRAGNNESQPSRAKTVQFTAKPQPAKQVINRRPQHQQTHCVLSEAIFDETTMTLQSSAVPPLVADRNASSQPLLCLEAVLHSPVDAARTVKTTVIFDSASTCSYITSDLATALDLPLIESQRIATQVFGKKRVDYKTVGIFPIGVTLRDGTQRNLATLSTPLICGEVKWLRKENESITQTQSTPSLLIGMDIFLEFFFGENFSMTRSEDGTHILSTPLGDIATKKRVNNRNLFSTILVNPSVESVPDLAKLTDMVKNFFSVEMIGVTDSPEIDDDDNKGLAHFLANIRFNESEQRYYVALPFRDENPQLPTNFEVYVDNYFGHASTIDEGTRQFHAVREFFAKASFNLREFVSNNQTLNHLFVSHNAAASDLIHAKILGVPWNTETDTYSLPSIKIPPAECKWTKRLILSHLNGFFDPFGLKVPVTLPTAKFHHIDGTLNPADVASRGCTSDELEDHPLWWKGPAFLTQPPATWNPQPLLSSPTLKETTMAVAALSTDPIHESIPPLIDASRFSTWTKMVNTLILILIFIQRLKKVPASLSRVSLHCRAEQLLFKMSQTEYPPSPHLIKQLRMYQCTSTSLWRCRGRINNAEIPIEAKHPVFLPRESSITRLYILYIHHSINHFGMQHTLTELRQRVWIPKGQATVKSSIRHCMHCKRDRAKQFKLPEYPDLPSIRTVRPDHPFSAVGLDLAGPMQYKTDEGKQSKCWLIIMTCLHIRATFLDLITDMSLKTLLSRIRRFVATHGTPSTIVKNDRSAIVKTATGTLHRPLSLLYKLEIEETDRSINPTNQPNPIEDEEAKEPNDKVRRLRRSARLNPTLMMLSTLALLSTVCATTDSRCPEATSAHLRMIYVTPCMQQGFGVATIQLTNTNTQQVCWLKMECPNGHLRMPNSTETNSNYCGPICKCPEWTRTCSFYDGKHRDISSISHLPSELKTYVPSQICSFKQEGHCEANGLFGIFAQIQLMDDNLLIVPELDITTTDVYSPDDHRCFGKHGEELHHYTLSSYNPVSGSSSFCRVHACSTPEEATAFCFYGGKAKGISVRACVGIYCTFIQELQSENPIPFPWSLVSEDHEIVVQSWIDGSSHPDEKIHCKGRPTCERLRCKMCLPFAFTPSCWSYLDALLFVLGTIFIGYIISRALDICKIASIFCNGFRRCCCFFIRRTPTNRTNPSQFYQPRRNRWKRNQFSATLMMTIAVLSISTIGHGCSEVSSIRAEEHECTRSQEGILHCTISNSAVLTLRPIGQTSCLVVRDADGEIGSVIEIRVDRISHKCDKQSMYFTRSHAFTTRSHHVCGEVFHPGTCEDIKCNSVDPSKPLPFFESNTPGFNFCASSCGCFPCGGCVSCSPSCIFYRIAASPTSSTIYEAFRCLQWINHVEIHITIETNDNERTSYTMDLGPGQTHRWNDLTATLISTNVAHSPILSSHFLTDGTRSCIIEDAPPSLFSPGSAGQLQCGTRKDANEFRCQFLPSTCTCSTSSTSASCSCPDGDMERFFKKEHRTLPLERQGLQLTSTSTGIEAFTTDNQVLQLKVKLDNLLLDTMVDFNECTISTSSATGCYNCIAGSQIETHCISSTSDTSTTFSCSDTNNVTIIDTIVKCSKNGERQKITFSANTNSIQLVCIYRCPGEKSQAKTTTITGELQFVDEVEKHPSNLAIETRTSEKNPANGFPSFDFHLFSLFSIPITIIIIIIIVIAFTVLYPRVCAY